MSVSANSDVCTSDDTLTGVVSKRIVAGMSQMWEAPLNLASEVSRSLSFGGLGTRIDRVLKRRHIDLSSADLVEIVAEASLPAEPLAAGEREFLLEHAGVSADDLSEGSLRQAAATVRVSETAASARARLDALTTSQAAALTGKAAANLRRMVGEQRLCTLGTSSSGSHLLPRWQFTEDGDVLPGIGEVLRALPEHYHPLDVTAFMQTSTEELGDRSPAEWLASGGAVDRVVALADERAWE